MNSGQTMPCDSPSPRRHRGDFMSAATRSAVMSRIRGRDTGPERLLAAELERRGCAWEGHARDLPGRPDFVFCERKLVVFVDGDFWHGWHFQKWRDKLSEKWENKIEAIRQRDVRNHRRLRRAGWKVVRIWEHQLKLDSVRCAQRVASLLEERCRVGSATPRKVGTR